MIRFGRNAPSARFRDFAQHMPPGMVPPRSQTYAGGGAQRDGFLASGLFTGESRRNPPAGRSWKKRLVIKGLRNHDRGVLDSFAESREASLRKPPCRKPASGSQPAEATHCEAVESACIFRLTKLPPLDSYLDHRRFAPAGILSRALLISPPYAQQRDYGATREKVGDWDALMQGIFTAAPVTAEGK